MSSRKIVCAVSLGAFLALAVGFIVASEVRAGGVDDLPLAGAVDTDTLERARTFEGEYVFAGGQKERDGVAAAIETSVASLNSMIRNLGRKRLTEANPVPKQVSISFEGDKAVVALDGHSYAVSLDGKPIKTKSREGDKVKVSHRMQGDKLVEIIDGSGGDRRNELKLSNDGKRLTLKVKISSGQLPVPVEYRLTFKRK
jgi:hypothetical protein